MSRAAQARVPAGTPAHGAIHPGEFTAAPATRGRRSGAPVPLHAALHNPVHEKGTSGHERLAVAQEHETRLPEEMAGNFNCHNCGWAGWREHPVMTREGAWHGTLAMAGCTRCGTLHPTHVGAAGEHSPQHSTARPAAARPSLAVAPTGRGTVPSRTRASTRVGKSIDTSETALQAQDLEGVEYVGHRQSCPRGGDGPCGAEVNGACGLCSAPVRDHEALSKTAATLLDLRKLAGL